MPSPRRRAKRFLAGLRPSEDLYFTHHTLIGGPDGPRFVRPDGTIDEALARDLWETHRDAILADYHHRDSGGLIPWASIAYDGEVGEWDPYAHLRAFQFPSRR